MRRLLATLLAPLIATSAFAEQTVWKTIDNWLITGDVKAGVCLASTEYVATGQQLLIGEYDKGWSLAINGTNATQGTNYLTEIVTSNGAREALAGVGLGQGLIIYKLGRGAVMQGLFVSDTVEFKGIGLFRIDGALAAMAATHACFEDITGSNT